MDHVTVGDLRAAIEDLPDDIPVLLVRDHDDAHTVNNLHIAIVKEARPGSGVFTAWFTPEEFAEYCDSDGVLLPNVIYTEKDRPPADGVRALTLWQ